MVKTERAPIKRAKGMMMKVSMRIIDMMTTCVFYVSHTARVDITEV